MAYMTKISGDRITIYSNAKKLEGKEYSLRTELSKVSEGQKSRVPANTLLEAARLCIRGLESGL